MLWMSVVHRCVKTHHILRSCIVSGGYRRQHAHKDAGGTLHTKLADQTHTHTHSAGSIGGDARSLQIDGGSASEPNSDDGLQIILHDRAKKITH